MPVAILGKGVPNELVPQAAVKVQITMYQKFAIREFWIGGVKESGNMEQLFFVLTMAFMFTHELDAIRRHEWRIFPGANLLSDEQGFLVFILIHIPLFGLVLWASFIGVAGTTNVFQIAFSMFCIIHIFLHKLNENHPAYEFKNPLSQFLIWGSGFAGAAHILIVYL